MEADAVIRKLREKQMEDAKKQEIEIRLMYEQGLSIEAVCSIKEMDIEEIKRILFRN